MQFEWDERKNSLNKRKHGLSFEAAALAFDDPFLLSVQDRRFEYSEDRWQSIGLVEQVALLVVHTIKEENENEEEIIRIISARAATSREEDRYYSFRKNSKRS